MLAISIIVIIILLSIILVMVSQNQKPSQELGMEGQRFKEIGMKPNAVSTQTIQSDKRIDALPMKATLEESVTAMKEAFAQYGGIVIKEEQSNYLYATAATKIVKFKDDIEVFFNETTQRVEYRSMSRVGYSDMGLNRTRYEAIAKLYEAL